jgi:chloramphenicol-sensitive protein RarD
LTIRSDEVSGVTYAVTAYVLWGFFPIYWTWLAAVPPLQLLAHRIVWSCVMLIGFVSLSRGWTAFSGATKSRDALAIYSIAAVAIAINWFMFIWAVTAGLVVQVSLGYYINPLVTVLFGVFVFRERLRRAQWLAMALAAIGVISLTASSGAPPWTALALAATFSTYGLLKKKAPLEPLPGLTLETMVLFLPAAGYLTVAELAGTGVLTRSHGRELALVVGSGLITTVPLLMFAAAAQRIRLTLMGVLQYINPTIQLLLGVYVYHEPFARPQLVGFACVWVALVIFGFEGLVATRAAQPADEAV